MYIVKCEICESTNNIIEKNFIVDKEPQYRKFHLCPLCYITILERSITSFYQRNQNDIILFNRHLVNRIEFLANKK